LIGVVPLRALIVTRPEATIDSIMKMDVVSVPVTADQEELAEMVARYDYYAIPVVDAGGRLLGVVTVDDVLDILEEETTEDIQRLGGSEPLEQPYFTASLWQVVRKRVVWLLLLFVASTLTSSVIHTYQGLLETVVVLGIFVPLIIGTGGNSGSQTVTTIIRAIAVGEVKLNDIQRAWRREVATGFIIGLLLGLIGFIQAMIWTGRLTIALVVGLTLPAVVMWANTSATLVPIIAERLGIDPTVVSAPMITTIVDATGLLIYFSIAQALL
jgi:magnesium transporter